MIPNAQMMETLLAACPAFSPEWEAFVDYWKEEPGELPLYSALTDFVRHVIGMLARRETATFPVIFAAVERLQTEGDHYFREAAVVGVLEDLQNLNLHTTTEPEQFRPFLGPESASAWDELYGLWNMVMALKAAGLLEPQSGSLIETDLGAVQGPELRRTLQQVYRRRLGGACCCLQHPLSLAHLVSSHHP